MRIFYRFCWFAILCFALFFLAMAIASCGSKKKLTQKSEFSTEIATVEKVSELTEKSVVKESLTTQKSEKLTEKETETFQAEIDDPTKKASVTKKEKDGETVWEFENVKHFNTGKEKSKIESKDSLGQKVSKTDKSISGKSVEKEEKAKASGKERSTDVAIKRGFPWWILIVVVVLYAVVSYIRKSINPFRWFL